MGLVREQGFKRMALQFASAQAQLMRSSADVWASLASQLAE
jgi:hypothetical protein